MPNPGLRTLCPWSPLKKIEDNLWPTDLVHMREKGYSALADLVLAAVKQTVGMDMESIKKTSNRGCSGGGGGGGSGVGGGGGGDSGG